jgi:hypothetical protein
MGDWGNDKNTQKTAAGNLAKYVQSTAAPSTPHSSPVTIFMSSSMASRITVAIDV